MPSGPRIRGNNVFGTTIDNPLTAGAVTMNSLGLANLPVVSSAHAIICLDPKRVNGEPEIVVVTSHSASATVATITRGQYGTTARSHPQNTAWAHVPLDEDYIEILTSSTRPTNPYEGQFIFETDTNKLVGFGGVDWASRDAGGMLGFAQTSNTTTNTFAAEVAISGLLKTVTTSTGRLYKVSFLTHSTADAVPATIQFRLRQSGAEIQLVEMAAVVASQRLTVTGFVLIAPVQGTYTYEVSAIRANGAATWTVRGFATDPMVLTIEDVGAA